jgi:serine/threonine-protein kinase
LGQDRAKRPEQNSGSNPSSLPGAPTSGEAIEGGTYFLGRYRVVDEIGIGGMASVHLARMDGPGGFQKWVAIKKIHSHLVEDESFVQMFLDEARVAARISHPNVATVFDLGKHDTTYWIAMEYLHGEPLREVMRRTEELGTAMPPEIACRVIADAAEGLHAAHELLGKNGEKLGLVHRDVTPHNLFVTYDGVTKVVDFGIAKFSSRASQTRAGTLKGKLAYMSPEQVQGEVIDRRTDIFALGVVLWELTTGQRLFRMDSDIDTLARVQECNVPRPSTLIRGYPVDLEKIVMKALAKNRGERFRTARELSRALQSLLMRRGLFIASDEVASYTQSIFADRIQKRDAHLRWASDVTQTINVDQLGSAAGDARSPAPTVPSANEIPSVGPAAGAPPRPGPMFPRGTPSEPFHALGPPRPAAGAPAMAAAIDPSWAENEVPTHHGIPLVEEPPNATPPTLLAARDREEVEDSTVAVLHDGELEDDQETLVTAASPEQPHDTLPPGAPPGFGPHAHPYAPGGFPQHPYGSQSVPTNEPQYTAPLGGSGSVPFGAPDGAYGPAGAPVLSPSGSYSRRSGSPNRTADGRNHQTMLAQRFRKRPPMWMVAALSCSFALFIAGVVIAIMSATSPRPRARGPVTSPTPSASGPFTAARAAFNSWSPPTTSPPSAIAPAPSPAPAPAPDPQPPTPASAAPTGPATGAAAPSTPVVAATPVVQPASRTITQPAAAPAPPRDTAAKAPGMGALTVVCIPKCDQIIDNGASLGPGHLFKKPVPSGKHLLMLSAPNGVKKTMTVDVLPNETREVRLSMDKP